MLYHKACAPAQTHIPGLSCVHLSLACVHACPWHSPVVYVATAWLGVGWLCVCVCMRDTHVLSRIDATSRTKARSLTMWVLQTPGPCRSFNALAMRGAKGLHQDDQPLRVGLRSCCVSGTGSRRPNDPVSYHKRGQGFFLPHCGLDCACVPIWCWADNRVPLPTPCTCRVFWECCLHVWHVLCV